VIQLREHGDALDFLVRARPRASRDEVRGIVGNALAVATTAAPEDGKANARIERVLAEFLDINKSAVTLESGATSRTKRFRARGVTAAWFLERVRALQRKVDPT